MAESPEVLLVDADHVETELLHAGDVHVDGYGHPMRLVITGDW